MRIIIAMTIMIGLAALAGAQAGEQGRSEPIALWPQAAPGEKGDLGPETDTTKPDGGLVDGKRVIRLTNVSQPTLTVYRPAAGKATGTAVVVCPGGGYRILAMDLEGTEICEWLNSIGVTGVLLKYRVPGRPGEGGHLAPQQDAQRAIRTVRARAKELGVDPQRIGIMGFSAGGHLAAVTSNNFELRTYTPVDETDKVSCRPDFAMLIYPAYLTIKDQLDKLAPEMTIGAKTPPTFLVQTEDDAVHVENGLVYYLALKQAKVPAEMHLYAVGGHGYGLRRTEKAVTAWPERAAEWLGGQGLLAQDQQRH